MFLIDQGKKIISLQDGFFYASRTGMEEGKALRGSVRGLELLSLCQSQPGAVVPESCGCLMPSVHTLAGRCLHCRWQHQWGGQILGWHQAADHPLGQPSPWRQPKGMTEACLTFSFCLDRKEIVSLPRGLNIQQENFQICSQSAPDPIQHPGHFTVNEQANGPCSDVGTWINQCFFSIYSKLHGGVWLLTAKWWFIYDGTRTIQVSFYLLS